jgi:16S rRNA (uracil1498-N3)-methyltransferase
MRIPRIYTERPLEINREVELGQSASRHLSKALRLKEGAAIILFNGEGGQYQATISSINKNSVRALLSEFFQADNESPLEIHLGICISRGERMDHIIQKSTELGVSEITPLFGERTEVKLNSDRQQKKLDHWQQIAISACEQSGRNRIPLINKIQKPEHWVNELEATTKLVLHHRNANTIKNLPASISVALLVGPEGGLSDDEISNAEKSGCQSLALGPRVLRTETAPLAAIAMLQAYWGDMG